MPAFSLFAFPATGAPTSRTEPDRWADWKNVLDFGADPTGVADSTTAIQNAINWTANDQRGTIYFPLGSYKVTAALSLYFGAGANQSIYLLGEGEGTIIFGTVNGYTIDRYDPTWVAESGIIIIEKMKVINGSTTAATGAVRLGHTNGAVVRDCSISGMNGIVLNQNELFGSGTDPLGAPQYLSENTLISNVTFGSPGERLPNSNAVVTGNGTTIINMDCSHWDCAVRQCGKGNNIVSGRFEENARGHIYGVDQFGNAVPAQGCSADGPSMESNRTAFMDLVNASNCVISKTGGNASPSDAVTADYGLRMRSGVSNIVVQSCSFTGRLAKAISIEDSTGTPGKGNVFIGCIGDSNVGGTEWDMPTKAKTATFIASDNPAPIFTFANLPGSSDRVFGNEYLISDSNVAVSAANFAATVTGGGAITAKVRWDGSQWIIA